MFLRRDDHFVPACCLPGPCYTIPSPVWRRSEEKEKRKKEKRNCTQEEHTYTIFLSLFRMIDETRRACTFVVITRKSSVENRADSLFGPVVDFFRARLEEKREREKEHGSHGSLMDGFDGCFDINPAS